MFCFITTSSSTIAVHAFSAPRHTQAHQKAGGRSTVLTPNSASEVPWLCHKTSNISPRNWVSMSQDCFTQCNKSKILSSVYLSNIPLFSCCLWLAIKGFCLLELPFLFYLKAVFKQKENGLLSFELRFILSFPRGINKKQQHTSHPRLVYSQRNVSVYVDTISFSFARERNQKINGLWIVPEKSHNTWEHMILFAFH